MSFWLKSRSTEVDALVGTVSLPPARAVKSTTLFPSLLPLTETARFVEVIVMPAGNPIAVSEPAVDFNP